MIKWRLRWLQPLAVLLIGGACSLFVAASFLPPDFVDEVEAERVIRMLYDARMRGMLPERSDAQHEHTIQKATEEAIAMTRWRVRRRYIAWASGLGVAGIVLAAMGKFYRNAEVKPKLN